MFFRQYRDNKRQTAAEARQKMIDAVQTRIDAAANIMDPSEKLLTLEQIGQDIAAQKYDIEKTARLAGENRSMLAALGTGTAVISIGFGIVSVCACPPAFMLLAVLPGCIGGIAAGQKVKDTIRGHAQEEVQASLEAMEGKRAALQAMSDVIVRENLEALVASPHFAELREKSGLKESFMNALEKRIAGNDAVPAAAPKKSEGGLNL